jgi:hypothetical protein
MLRPESGAVFWERAATVLEAERQHATARPCPALDELVQPRALQRTVDEDVLVALELGVGTVVVDAVRVVRRGTEQEELRAARVLQQRRQQVAGGDVFDATLFAHRAILRPRRIAISSPFWSV